MQSFDVEVRGAGIVGRSLALCLARLGLEVALRAAPARTNEDVRAYALNPASVALLRDLKVWDALPAHAATAVHEMRVQGDAAAELDFSAWQQRVGALAWITDAAALERQLAEAVRFAPHITPVDADVEAALVAVCEGRDSARRAELGASVDCHDYGHQAIAARLVASDPHRGIARQWFRAPDVLALLPFDTPEPGRSYGLVWSLPEARAQELLALDAAAFEDALQQASGGTCGTLELASARAAWPLRLCEAAPLCGPGWVLLGDAAHTIHPLAGQGLNLGLGDVSTLATVIAAREPWRGLGDERLLRRYARARSAPTWAMARATDTLLQLFSREAPALRELRNGGLTLVNHLTPLKRWLTARALHS